MALSVATLGAQDKPVSRSSEVSRQETIGRKAEEQQIKVLSEQPLIKTHFAVYARSIRSRFRHLLGLYRDDEWQVDLYIYLYGTGTDVYSGNDIMLEGDFSPGNIFRVKMFVKVHDRFQEEKFRLALLRMLVIEQMLSVYHDNPNSFPEASVLEPPDWLVHGFDYLLKHRELGRPSYFYSGFLESGQLMRVDEITDARKTKGLTPLSMELFRASSSVLVSALCEQRGGGESMRGLLGDIATKPATSPLILIKKNFPALRETGEGIDKWWALQLASLAQQQSFEYFSAEETEKHLDSLLKVSLEAIESPSAEARSTNAKPSLLNRIKDSSRNLLNRDNSVQAFEGTLADFAEFLGHPKAAEALKYQHEALLALKVKAFPLYRDVIDQYAIITAQLGEKDTKGVTEQLASLDKTRKSIGQTLAHAKDYLNYYEATKFPGRSKAFESYLKFKEEMKSGSLPKRTDPISRHLDEVEKQLGW